MIVSDAVNVDPVCVAPELPIVAAFTVAAMIVSDAVIPPTFDVPELVNEVALNDPNIPEAPVLPIVAAFTVAAMIVPDAVNVDPVCVAFALPIVAAFTVLAIIVLELVIAPLLIDPVYNAPAIPAPPETTSTPVVVLVLAVVLAAIKLPPTIVPSCVPTTPPLSGLVAEA